jgi:hypothetical protein
VDVDLTTAEGELAALRAVRMGELPVVLPIPPSYLPTRSGCEQPERYGREGRQEEDLCWKGRRERIFGRARSRFWPHEPGFGAGMMILVRFGTSNQVSKWRPPGYDTNFVNLGSRFRELLEGDFYNNFVIVV